eukprot:TRINITY_DN101667_c0_g1_i1.p1 TRINITY_DN101667_c0_g1~~TRINITY_DN101667_c0_g1_i1.p1  ORF type:complete len:246 (-),score=43.27 TRINITY_DN101667_c0_g1_i1:255-992(-)
MGGSSSLLPWASRPEPIDFLMLGLDFAGKTTILHSLKPGKVTTSIPTIGFNTETLEFRPGSKVVTMTSWDVGGRDKIRALWRHFYKGKHILVYVVDSTDVERIEDASLHLQSILQEAELKGVPLLVCANKQDLPRALSVNEVTEKLGLHALRDRRWYIAGTIGTTGDGVHAGLEWCINEVQMARSAKDDGASSETAPTLLERKKAAEARKDHGEHDIAKANAGLDLGKMKLAGLLRSKLFPPLLD